MANPSKRCLSCQRAFVCSTVSSHGTSCQPMWIKFTHKCCVKSNHFAERQLLANWHGTRSQQGSTRDAGLNIEDFTATVRSSAAVPR